MDECQPLPRAWLYPSYMRRFDGEPGTDGMLLPSKSTLATL